MLRRMLMVTCCIFVFFINGDSQLPACRYAGVCGTDNLTSACFLNMYYSDCDDRERS